MIDISNLPYHIPTRLLSTLLEIFDFLFLIGFWVSVFEKNQAKSIDIDSNLWSLLLVRRIIIDFIDFTLIRVPG